MLGVKDTPYDRSYLKNKNVYAYAWDNVWEWGQGDRAYKLANADYKVFSTRFPIFKFSIGGLFYLSADNNTTAPYVLSHASSVANILFI